MSESNEIFNLNSSFPDFNVDRAYQIIKKKFDIEGVIKPLQGDRDKNFCLYGDNENYMVRFIHPAESEREIRFQTELLRHIEINYPHLPVQRVICDRQGDYHPKIELDNNILHVRVVSYLEGVPQYLCDKTNKLMDNLGYTLGLLDNALSDFNHVGSQRDLLWDMNQIGNIIGKCRFIKNVDLRNKTQHVFKNHIENVCVKQQVFPWQVIHNDLNPYNVLVNKKDASVSGVIDFGDAVFSPRVNDLAVALAYQIADEVDPLIFVRPFLSNYMKAMPLTEEEISLLPDLIAARLCLIITIASWRASLYPENSRYILRNLPNAERSLNKLYDLSRDFICDQLLNTAFSRGKI